MKKTIGISLVTLAVFAIGAYYADLPLPHL